MTLADFSAAHPDLANDWANANNPAYASDPNAAWILAYGTLDAYLTAAAANYGTPITGTTTGGTVSPLFDPVHRLRGYTRQGYEVYTLVDETGRIIEWYDIPGRGATGQHVLESLVDPSSYVYTTSKPGGGVTTGTPAGGNSDKTLIWVAIIGAAGLWIANRRK